MDRGAWWPGYSQTHGVTESQTRLKQLNMQHAQCTLLFEVLYFNVFFQSFKLQA